MVRVTIEFGGGLDVLFGHQKTIEADLPSTSGEPVKLVDVIKLARDKYLTERVELFAKGDSVRPGILVLINDTDWELSGREDAELEEGDTVLFISTLHGG